MTIKILEIKRGKDLKERIGHRSTVLSGELSPRLILVGTPLAVYGLYSRRPVTTRNPHFRSNIVSSISSSASFSSAPKFWPDAQFSLKSRLSVVGRR